MLSQNSPLTSLVSFAQRIHDEGIIFRLEWKIRDIFIANYPVDLSTFCRTFFQFYFSSRYFFYKVQHARY